MGPNGATAIRRKAAQTPELVNVITPLRLLSRVLPTEAGRPEPRLVTRSGHSSSQIFGAIFTVHTGKVLGLYRDLTRINEIEPVFWFARWQIL